MSEFDEKVLFGVCKWMRNDQMIISDYIEQLSGLLFLKACQESPRINQDNLDIPESARWDRLVSDEERREQSILETYDEMINELQTDGELARKAFNNFNNKFGSETTLKNTVDDIESLDFWDHYEGYSDFFGDAYEFLLEKYADKADGAGEYFTPRPLIHAMVKAVDPEYTESIYDPASGTNGFLIAAYNHVGEKTAGKITGKKRQFLNTPDDGPDSYAEQLTGRELTSQTYRLGLMNLILHDIDPTEMTSLRGNSLTREVDEEYDIIVANPPYGGNGSDRFSGAWAESNAPETNFLQLIMRSLSENGRAAVIVPEGVLFRGGAEKSVRMRLLEQYHLDCILVLPENCFHPYAGVDANVLFFKRDLDGTEDVWYCDLRTDMENIKQSNPLTKDHFDEFLNNYHNTADRKESYRFFNVPIERIEENNYDLTHKTYRNDTTNQYRPPSEIVDDIESEILSVNTSIDTLLSEIGSDAGGISGGIPDKEDIPDHWKIKKVEDVIIEANLGGTPSRSEEDYWGGDIPWISSGAVSQRGKYTTENPEESITKRGLEESSTYIWPKGTVLVAMHGRGTIGSSAITSIDTAGNQSICGLQVDEQIMNHEFLYYWFQNIKQHLVNKGQGATASRQNLNQGIILDTVVIVPPIEEQDRIVHIIEENKTNGAQNAASNLIQLFDEYRESLLAHACLGKLDESTLPGQQDSEIDYGPLSELIRNNSD